MEIWKCVSIVLIYLVTLEVWKCGNVEICRPHCLNLSNNSGSVEMWKCGNMSSLSLSNNSGSVEVWKYVLIVLIYLITLEVSKCGNVEMWKYVFNVFI